MEELSCLEQYLRRIRRRLADLDRHQAVGLWGQPHLLQLRRMMRAVEDLPEEEYEALAAWYRQQVHSAGDEGDATLLDWPGWQRGRRALPDAVTTSELPPGESISTPGKPTTE